MNQKERDNERLSIMNKNTRHHVQMTMLIIAAVLFVIAVYKDMGLAHAISACVVSLVFLSGIIFFLYGDDKD